MLFQSLCWKKKSLCLDTELGVILLNVLLSSPRQHTHTYTQQLWLTDSVDRMQLSIRQHSSTVWSSRRSAKVRKILSQEPQKIDFMGRLCYSSA